MPARKYHITISITGWLDNIIQTLLFLTLRLSKHKWVCRIPLTQGKYAIVDTDDYPWLSKYKWHATRKGNRHYASRFETRNGKRVHIYMHRQIMEHKLSAIRCTLDSDLLVDHIDRNPLNNCKSNLRLATNTQNNWNSERGKNMGTSGYKGTSWKPDKRKWQAAFYINGKQKSLGYFDNEIDAARAYDRAALKHRGEFAVLNFPDAVHRR